MPKKKAAKASETEEKSSFAVENHVLVPKHEVCTAEEKEAILTRYRAQPYQMPRITANDAAIRHLGVKVGDLIKITRHSETAGQAVFYRIVSSE